MSPTRICSAILTFSFLLSLTACGEPDRETYRDMAAEEVCAEAERCDNLNADGFYDNYSECILEERSNFNSYWPSSECDEGRINAERYETCIVRARLYACTASFTDLLSAANHCQASEVCID